MFQICCVSDDSRAMAWRDQRGWELMDPHQKSLRFCLCAQRIEITDALIFRNGKSGAMGLSPFSPYKSPLKRNQFSSLDSASKAICLPLLFSPGL